MVVTDFLPRCLPHLLLRIQLRRGYWKTHHLQARMRRQKLPDSRHSMPRSSIPQQQNRTIRHRREYLPQMSSRRLSVHLVAARGDDRSGGQVKRAVEVRLLARGRSINHGRSAPGRPHTRQGRLQIQTGLILGQNDGLRRLLDEVKELFFQTLLEIEHVFLTAGRVELRGPLITKSTPFKKPVIGRVLLITHPMPAFERPSQPVEAPVKIGLRAEEISDSDAASR